MKNLHVLIYAAMLLMLISTSCLKKKDNSLIIQGTVSDSLTSLPVTSAKIQLSARILKSGTYSSGYSVLETNYSDNNGKYVIDIEAENTVSYRLKAEATGYFNIERELTDKDIPTGITNTIDIKMVPYSTINITVFNKFPFDENDVLSYWIIPTPPVCADCCTDEHTSFYGKTVNQTISCIYYGGFDATVNYRTIKNGQSLSSQKHIHCPPFGSVDVVIEY